eukprot:NODE_808_length_4048_cov_0.263105.p1 type:complete len:481 gc:universal NODE_808_length_4048_cov_0.263105:3578-2136(-)
MESYKYPDKHDSTIDIHESLSDRNHKTDNFLSKWCKSFFPDQLPDRFHNIDKTDLDRVKGASVFFDYFPITYLKSFHASLTMKILHPMAYLELCQKVKEKLFDDTPKVLQDFWDNTHNVYYTSNAETLKGLRNELMKTGSYVSRLDIIRFYHSFYSHAMFWIAAGSRKDGKEKYDSKNYSGLKWADALDAAIQNCQWKQTRGVPIGSKLVDELAEAFLIILDGIIVKRVTALGISVNTFSIIRCRDNYDIIAVNNDTLILVERICVSVLLEFELNITFEPAWTRQLISYESIKSDLLVQISTVPVNDCMKLLSEHRRSMDYGFALNLCITRLSSFTENAHFHSTLCELLRSHPKCIKTVMEKISRSDNQDHIYRISSFYLGNLDDFVFGSVTCQLVCILDFVCAQFNRIGKDWLAPESVLLKLEKEESFRNHFLFSTYMSHFRALKDDENAVFPMKTVIGLLADALERPKVKNALEFDLS